MASRHRAAGLVCVLIAAIAVAGCGGGTANGAAAASDPTNPCLDLDERVNDPQWDPIPACKLALASLMTASAGSTGRPFRRSGFG